MAEDSNNEYTPLDLSMKDKATPSTSHDGNQGASSTLGAYTTISDDTLWYQRNTQHPPMTDETCNVASATDNGSTSCQPLVSINDVDNVRPSTSRAGMEKASANVEDGATNATGTGGMEQQDSCGVEASDQSSAKKSTHKCEICGKLTREARNLAAHCRTHAREKPYKCESCDKSFAHRQSLYNHQRIHAGVKPHLCHICTKPFKSKAELESHLKSHSKDRPFICDICNLSFKRNWHLQRHRERFHGDEKPYIEEYINDEWKALNRQTDATDVNERRVNTSPVFSGNADATDSGSTNCAPAVSSASADHARPSTSRAGIEKLLCTTKDIARKAHLKNNLALHCSDKPFVCEICNVSFTRNQNLISHRQCIHNSVIPY
nr:zinc finger protein 502-like [Dermacentor andersoni]